MKASPLYTENRTFRNILVSMISTFGKSIGFNTLKCLSCVIKYPTLLAIAQQTYNSYLIGAAFD